MRYATALGAAAAVLGVLAPRQEPRRGPELLGAEFRHYAELEVTRGFERLVHRELTPAEIEEALWLFEQRALDLPSAVGRELGEREQRNLEARATLEKSGPLEMLRNLASGGAGPMEEFVASREALADLFPRSEKPNALGIGAAEDVERALLPGATITLAAGVHELGNFLGAVEEFPREVALSGVGRDATLIVLTEPLSSRSPLEDFKLARCTVLAEAGQLFAQNHPSTVELEDVRVIGFDRGIQHGALLDFRSGAALSAHSCAFLGGYGPLPGGGLLLSATRTALIARFEACEFDLHSLGLSRLERGVTVRFVDCPMKRILDDPLNDTEHWRGVEFEGGSLQRIRASMRPTEPRGVDELFRGWREKLGRK